MPSTRRWSVPQRRIIISAVLAVVGTFLAFGGLGMGRWSVAAVGIAIIALGGATVVLSAFNSRAMSEVEGTAHVVSRSAPPTGVTQGRCRLELIVSARGVDSVTVKTREPAVPVSKWPDRGADLPVMVAIDNPQRTRVVWHLVPTHAEVAAERVRERGRTGAMPAGDDYYVDEQPSYGADFGPDPDAMAAQAQPATSAMPDESAEAMAAGVGTRTIEMDVMDPSLMRWSEPPQTRAKRPPGSRPSPRPRRPEEQVSIDEWEAGPPRAEAPVDAEVIDESPVPTRPTGESPNDEPLDVESHVETPPTEDAQPDESVADDAADTSPDVSAANDAVAASPPGDEVPVTRDSAVAAAAAAAAAAAEFSVGTDLPPAPRSSAEGPQLTWPPTSAAAAAHRWDYTDGEEDEDEPLDEPILPTDDLGADYEGWFTSETQPTARRVPHNRLAPDEEVDDAVDDEDVFEPRGGRDGNPTGRDDAGGQDVTDDGPGYSRGPGYSSGTGYDDDTRYNPNTDYA